jgi:hypothetical protein
MKRNSLATVMNSAVKPSENNCGSFNEKLTNSSPKLPWSRTGQNKPRAGERKTGVCFKHKETKPMERRREKRKEACRSAYNVHLFFLHCLSRAHKERERERDSTTIF